MTLLHINTINMEYDLVDIKNTLPRPSALTPHSPTEKSQPLFLEVNTPRKTYLIRMNNAFYHTLVFPDNQCRK